MRSGGRTYSLSRKDFFHNIAIGREDNGETRCLFFFGKMPPPREHTLPKISCCIFCNNSKKEQMR